MEKKHEDGDMIIPVYYKENIVAYTRDTLDDITFKFINEENDLKVFGETKNLTFVKFYKENDKTSLSHMYILDDSDVEKFNRGELKWSGDM
jgi:hypothetical protein